MLHSGRRAYQSDTTPAPKPTHPGIPKWLFLVHQTASVRVHKCRCIVKLTVMCSVSTPDCKTLLHLGLGENAPIWPSEDQGGPS